jgi:ASC-1-like (ASCH) protein
MERTHKFVFTDGEVHILTDALRRYQEYREGLLREATTMTIDCNMPSIHTATEKLAAIRWPF